MTHLPAGPELGNFYLDIFTLRQRRGDADHKPPPRPGTTVDLTLFPLDTLKTRLQSSTGFFPSGGFRGIYRGVGSCLVGSAPGAAFFFSTYEFSKSFLSTHFPPLPSSPNQTSQNPYHHMLSASLGEIAACAVRVPTEVVKQRAQAGHHGGSSWNSLRHILGQYGRIGPVGVWRELYRGWTITIIREVPFTVLQFPLWESLKSYGRARKQRTGRGLFGDSSSSSTSTEVSAPESALYGSVAGGFAAAVTTPLDVLKTRVMLSTEKQSMFKVMTDILRENGIRPFFAGIGPRVMWISIGGAIFLGSYQWAVNTFAVAGEEDKRGRESIL
ncbi:mitochondrial carrier domain-containing protein [Apiosordaria backusii]|uniref:Mitochondrial carrier domain-containing protein n=1 Tax=Apiosordaria backusii TaxID=314023 RepID=A0AA40K157_9PEZI|nr:mitochondrial carrier domain-containing protein [Apiosordaria backusii]